ncbi:Leucoanthocyanidin dioxygenase [Dichanthelium oligosanthes]|uniref:Leucoanthocyanidin dioxygenase n=1 Tax=Dichanthelium oligosanthes TaxID=888268 RepID=A0A1E5ULM5_9POAL|nr:Leucoanthocyanidin dioxygenase [Dichanthelium oligosanthes]
MEMAMAMESPPTLPPVPPQQPARVEALNLSGLSAIPPEYVRPANQRADLGDTFDLARTHAHDSPFLMLDSSSKDDHKKRQREECVEAVRAAATDWGVMHVAGRGIPAELMDRLHAARSTFFALPIQAKEAYANDLAAGRLQGYDSRLATNPSGQHEWEDYLFHLLHPDSLTDHALWPAHPPDYVAATRDFGRRIREVASTLLAILSTDAAARWTRPQGVERGGQAAGVWSRWRWRGRLREGEDKVEGIFCKYHKVVLPPP